MPGHVEHSGIDGDVEELHAARDEPDEWDEEPAAVRVRPATTSVVSFRMPHSELDRLQSIAGARGESISDFVRDSIRVRIGHLSDTRGGDRGEHVAATEASPEVEAVARIDGIGVDDVIRTAITSHVAARRRDPGFQTRLQREQTVLRSLVE
ncbi:MAG: ribbon-helix-helix protein, CopG family [bacterium]|nr:ribbon-helix-helix protein, CopG family [bacterium]